MSGYRVLEPIFEDDATGVETWAIDSWRNSPPIDRTALSRLLIDDGFGVSILPHLDDLGTSSRMLTGADREALAILASALRNLAVAVDPKADCSDLTSRWYDGTIDPASVRKASDRYLAGVCSAQTARQVDDEIGAPAVAAIVASATVLSRHPSVTTLIASTPSIWPTVTRLSTAHATLVASAGKLRGASPLAFPLASSFSA